MSRETLNFSMYSLMSTRISASEVSNMNSANILAKCVLPTPVGPININEPMGLLGSFNPILLR
ncbi:hypothetical protein SDC9_189935 [bioreactor metagenome]|uniref:Uncharacterized protein n=1 Tax=bioreactor metagenome TaxID=1076179 RepID=A0A645HTK5_9ZZZZ